MYTIEDTIVFRRRRATFTLHILPQTRRHIFKASSCSFGIEFEQSDWLMTWVWRHGYNYTRQSLPLRIMLTLGSIIAAK